MKFIIKLVGFGLLLTACACNSDSVTGPDTEFSPAGSGNVTASATQPAQPASDAPTSSVDIKVTNKGVVKNNTQTTYTACLFDAPYGEGKLVEEWKAKPGRTSMSYTTDTCEPGKGQIDITPAGKCTELPHGMEIVAANVAVVIPAGLSGDACSEPECTEEPSIVSVERGEEGEWGECEEVRPGSCAKTRTFEEITTWKQCDKTWTTTEVRPEYERCECGIQRRCTVRTPRWYNGEDNYCFDNPIGNENDECALFGLEPLGKTEFDSGKQSTHATMDAEIAFVKGGLCYRIYNDVEAGDWMRGPSLTSPWRDISHVTYCGCPDED